MQELRFVAVSEDGSYAVLAVPGRSGRYILPIDERLRAVAQGQTSRLAQYEIEVESPLRPKEIQARIRAGETAEEIADAAGIPVERVRWFEGPVLAERAYIADQAQAGSVRRAGDSSGPGPRLGDIVTARLSAAGTDPADGQWDSRKRGDGNWQVSLTFPSGGRLHVAEWVFDPRRRHVMPDDDNAARLSLPESELPAEPVPVPGEATVTPIASRLGAAAAMGGGSGGSRFRPERSVIPDRSLGGERSLADRPMPPSAPAPERTAAMSDRSAVSDRHAAPERPSPPSPPVPPRPAQPDRPDYQNRAAYRDYVDFPESAPYRIPTPAEEPPAPAHRDQAQERAYDRDAQPGHRGYADPASVSSAAHAEVADRPAYREPAPEPRTYREPAPEAAGYPAAAPPEPAFGGHAPERAAQAPAAQAPPAQVTATAATEDSERLRPAPPRPVVFEDPEPAFGDDRPERPAERAKPRPAPEAYPVTEPARAPEPAAFAPAARPEPEAPAASAPSVPAPSVPAPSVPAPPVAPAAAVAAQAADASAAVTPVAEVAVAAEPAVTAQPEIRTPEPVAERAAPSVAAAAPAPVAAPPAPAAPVATEPPVVPEPPVATEPAAAATPEPEPAAVASGPAAPATPEQKQEAPAAAEPAPADDQASRPRAGAKKTAKGRRSSVPSWDEIMLGSSRQRD